MFKSTVPSVDLTLYDRHFKNRISNDLFASRRVLLSYVFAWNSKLSLDIPVPRVESMEPCRSEKFTYPDESVENNGIEFLSLQCFISQVSLLCNQSADWYIASSGSNRYPETRLVTGGALAIL